MTAETNRMNNEEISNQRTRKLNEIKESLIHQIQDAISRAITSKVLLSIQNTLYKHGKVNYKELDRESRGPQEGLTGENYSTVDHRSGGLQWNLESENNLKTREKRDKTRFSQENDGQMSRQSSVDSTTGDQNRDIYRAFFREREPLHTKITPFASFSLPLN